MMRKKILRQSRARSKKVIDIEIIVGVQAPTHRSTIHEMSKYHGFVASVYIIYLILMLEFNIIITFATGNQEYM